MNDRGLVEVVVPQLGEAVSEVRIVEWVKNEGDRITTGDVLFIVDTEKAEVDVEAFVDGVLVEIAVADDAATLPGAVVGLIRTRSDVKVTPRGRRLALSKSLPRSEALHCEGSGYPEHTVGLLRETDQWFFQQPELLSHCLAARFPMWQPVRIVPQTPLFFAKPSGPVRFS